ncbi:hypothetical protein [Sphingomonas sp. 28-63-12]|uniref:hypothetical protein n=1 Tax=Sphingomonas sp. 28-63-12 TaxID=1970434 RepID=UPI000BC4ADDF|nr:MAG: hypothetical protein B7Y47_14470 [Sphingomonas sp. 28-63-12]
MPGFILHVGATVLCSHAGLAQPTAPNPRVTVSGQPIVTIACPYTVAGCTFPALSSGAPPCATAQFMSSAVRVTAMGQPVLLIDSQASCVPTGTPLIIAATQPRAMAM